MRNSRRALYYPPLDLCALVSLPVCVCVCVSVDLLLSIRDAKVQSNGHQSRNLTAPIHGSSSFSAHAFRHNCGPSLLCVCRCFGLLTVQFTATLNSVALQAACAVNNATWHLKLRAKKPRTGQLVGLLAARCLLAAWLSLRGWRAAAHALSPTIGEIGALRSASCASIARQFSGLYCEYM